MIPGQMDIGAYFELRTRPHNVGLVPSDHLDRIYSEPSRAFNKTRFVVRRSSHIENPSVHTGNTPVEHGSGLVSYAGPISSRYPLAPVASQNGQNYYLPSDSASGGYDQRTWNTSASGPTLEPWLMEEQNQVPWQQSFMSSGYVEQMDAVPSGNEISGRLGALQTHSSHQQVPASLPFHLVLTPDHEDSSSAPGHGLPSWESSISSQATDYIQPPGQGDRARLRPLDDSIELVAPFPSILDVDQRVEALSVPAAGHSEGSGYETFRMPFTTTDSPDSPDSILTKSPSQSLGQTDDSISGPDPGFGADPGSRAPEDSGLLDPGDIDKDFPALSRPRSKSVGDVPATRAKKRVSESSMEQVFTTDMETTRSRKRRRLEPGEKQDVNNMRRRGACDVCHAKKQKCLQSHPPSTRPNRTMNRSRSVEHESQSPTPNAFSPGNMSVQSAPGELEFRDH